MPLGSRWQHGAAQLARALKRGNEPSDTNKRVLANPHSYKGSPSKTLQSRLSEVLQGLSQKEKFSLILGSIWDLGYGGWGGEGDVAFFFF